MIPLLGPLLASIPWIALPVAALVRGRGSRTLDQEASTVATDAPTVAVVIPARNEAHNIERCVRSVLTTTYPSLGVVIVDDRSEDGTGDIARRIARTDARVRVIDAPPLPPDWFGKQWACAQGAAAANGEIICFADADTIHSPDLLPRAINAMQSRRVDLLSVAGFQELGTFWERVIQPQVFGMLAARYGGTEAVNRSRNVADKIANGQCLIVRRAAYDEIGGHAAVRHKVAEDLAMAQRFFLSGKPQAVVLGVHQLRTRMYTSLRELVSGWMKNIFVGALDATPGGRRGRALLPFLIPLPPLALLAPPVVLAISVLDVVPPGVQMWAAISTGVTLLWWMFVYRSVIRLSPLYALTYPLGNAMLLYIIVRAISRGRRVRWKGREYQST